MFPPANGILNNLVCAWLWDWKPQPQHSL